MLVRSLASGALVEVADDLAPEMLAKGWVSAQRVPAAKKGAPVAGVDDPGEVEVPVADPTVTPKKRAPRKATS